MLSAAVAAQDQELRRYAAALGTRTATTPRRRPPRLVHVEDAAEYNSRHFTRAPAAAPPVCAGNWEPAAAACPRPHNPGGKWMGPTCCAGAPVNSFPARPLARLAPPAPARSRSPPASLRPAGYSCKNYGEWFGQCRPHARRAARRRRQRSQPATRVALGRTVGGDRGDGRREAGMVLGRSVGRVGPG